jgi:translation elongation factor EF-G
MDYRPDEQQRGITMKASVISMVHTQGRALLFPYVVEVML